MTGDQKRRARNAQIRIGANIAKLRARIADNPDHPRVQDYRHKLARLENDLAYWKSAEATAALDPKVVNVTIPAGKLGIRGEA